MTKFVLGIFAIALLTGIGQLYFPWWIIVPIAFVIGALLGLKGWKSFLYGFLGVALLWGIYAGWINSQNEGILATKVGQLFGGLSPFLLIVVTALIGGLVSGLATLSGSLGRQLLSKT